MVGLGSGSGEIHLKDKSETVHLMHSDEDEEAFEWEVDTRSPLHREELGAYGEVSGEQLAFPFAISRFEDMRWWQCLLGLVWFPLGLILMLARLVVLLVATASLSPEVLLSIFPFLGIFTRNIRPLSKVALERVRTEKSVFLIDHHISYDVLLVASVLQRNAVRVHMLMREGLGRAGAVLGALATEGKPVELLDTFSEWIHSKVDTQGCFSDEGLATIRGSDHATAFLVAPTGMTTKDGYTGTPEHPFFQEAVPIVPTQVRMWNMFNMHLRTVVSSPLADLCVLLWLPFSLADVHFGDVTPPPEGGFISGPAARERTARVWSELAADTNTTVTPWTIPCKQRLGRVKCLEEPLALWHPSAFSLPANVSRVCIKVFGTLVSKLSSKPTALWGGVGLDLELYEWTSNLNVPVDILLCDSWERSIFEESVRPALDFEFTVVYEVPEHCDLLLTRTTQLTGIDRAAHLLLVNPTKRDEWTAVGLRIPVFLAVGSNTRFLSYLNSRESQIVHEIQAKLVSPLVLSIVGLFHTMLLEKNLLFLGCILVAASVDADLMFLYGQCLGLLHGLTVMAKNFVPRPRPLWMPQDVAIRPSTRFDLQRDCSFFSGHTAFMTTLWITTILADRPSWLIALMTVGALLTGVARLIVAAHFLSDVVVGYVVAGIGTLLVFLATLLPSPFFDWGSETGYLLSNDVSRQFVVTVIVCVLYLLVCLGSQGLAFPISPLKLHSWRRNLFLRALASGIPVKEIVPCGNRSIDYTSPVLALNLMVWWTPSALRKVFIDNGWIPFDYDAGQSFASIGFAFAYVIPLFALLRVILPYLAGHPILHYVVSTILLTSLLVWVGFVVPIIIYNIYR